jgi:hypothetical protein
MAFSTMAFVVAFESTSNSSVFSSLPFDFLCFSRRQKPSTESSMFPLQSVLNIKSCPECCVWNGEFFGMPKSRESKPVPPGRAWYSYLLHCGFLVTGSMPKSIICLCASSHGTWNDPPIFHKGCCMHWCQTCLIFPPCEMKCLHATS